MNKDIKVSLAIVTNRLIQPQTVKCLLNLVNQTKLKLHIIISQEHYTTAQGRIYCVVQAMKNKSDWILYCDDDMILEKDTLDRLLAHGKEIVGVNSYSRTLPLSTTLMMTNDKGEYKDPSKHTEWEMRVPEELFEVLAIGTGVALIKMEVFEKLKKPWFKFEMHPDGWMKQGEDAWFCSQARKAGYKIWADGSLKIGHIGSYIYQKSEEFTTFVPSVERTNSPMVGEMVKFESTNI